MKKIEQTNYKKVTEQQASTPELASSTTTTSSSTHTAGRVSDLSAMDLEAIRLKYVDVLGGLNSVKAKCIDDALMNGCQPDVIIDAIEQAAMAARPSHYYFAKVLQRYVNEGLFTLADVERDRAARRLRRQEILQKRYVDWFIDPNEVLY